MTTKKATPVTYRRPVPLTVDLTSKSGFSSLSRIFADGTAHPWGQKTLMPIGPNLSSKRQPTNYPRHRSPFRSYQRQWPLWTYTATGEDPLPSSRCGQSMTETKRVLVPRWRGDWPGLREVTPVFELQIFIQQLTWCHIQPLFLSNVSCNNTEQKQKKTRQVGNYNDVLPLKATQHDSIFNLTSFGASNLSCRQTQYRLVSLWGPRLSLMPQWIGDEREY